MHLQPIRRRRLLKLGALSAVALGTAGTFMFARRHGSGHDTSGYGPFLVLDDDHVRTLRALTDVVLPTAVAGDDALHRKVIARIDEEFYFVDGKIRDDFRLALDALEYLPVMYGRFSRFSWLETDARRAFLDDM